MSPLTPETLPRHELAGLDVEVVDATNPDLVGIAGRVVRETAGTLHVAGRDRPGDGATGRTWQVPKSGTTFEFALGAEESGTETYATVDGTRLLARPARRTETGGTSPWR